MKTNIVRIGNSRGVRIPKSLLDETGLAGEVEVRRKGRTIVIEPARLPREGWAESAKRMAAAGDDELIGGNWPETDFDRIEWQW